MRSKDTGACNAVLDKRSVVENYKYHILYVLGHSMRNGLCMLCDRSVIHRVSRFTWHEKYYSKCTFVWLQNFSWKNTISTTLFFVGFNVSRVSSLYRIVAVHCFHFRIARKIYYILVCLINSL